MRKKVIITQSNYIPWKGYFDSINMVDLVILYDDMQYTKRDWRNRNQIKTPQGLKWISIPVEVKGKYYQAINETKISDKDWSKSHWDIIRQNYSKSPFFSQYKDAIEELYLDCNEDLLSLINYRFLDGINEILGIKTPMIFSSEYELVEGRTERLIDLCKKVGATDYYSGPAARNYMDEKLFEEESIKLNYFEYSGYPEYPQLHGAFAHGVTILDLIFNTGLNAQTYMKSFKDGR